MADHLEQGTIPNRIGPQVATAANAVEPVTVARGPLMGAAIGGALASIGAGLVAVPFPLPWLGPLLSAVLIGVGTVIAAANGARIDPPRKG